MLLLCLFLTVIEPAVLEFRIVVGIADKASHMWEGAIAVQGGELAGVEGWHFSQNDVARPNGKFEFRTKTVPPTPETERRDGVYPQGLTVRIRGDETTQITFETRRAKFTFTPADVPPGKKKVVLGGNATVERRQ